MLTENIVCPTCSNKLQFYRTDPEEGFPEGRNQIRCRTCPFFWNITGRTIYETHKFKPKKVDAVAEEQASGEVVDGESASTKFYHPTFNVMHLVISAVLSTK